MHARHTQGVTLSEITVSDVMNVDDIELPDELPQPERSAVYRIADIGIQTPPARMQASIKRRKGDGARIWPMFHMALEPLSFKLDFNPDVFTDNPNNYEDVWLTIFTDEGELMGPTTQFGKTKAAFDAAGYKITKNEVFRPLLLGTTWRTKTEVEEWSRKDKEGKVTAEGKNWIILPQEQLADYTPPPAPRVIRRGYSGSSGGSVRSAEPSAEQVAALKRALNGKSEDEYVDAVMFAGDPLVSTDPFIGEAGDPALLTERAIKYGGKVVAGRVYFADVVSA